MSKDDHPDTYGDLMIEAVRVVPTGADEVCAAFQVWDMEDFENERSILFRVRGFETAERVWDLKGLVRDVWSSADVVGVLEDKQLFWFEGGAFDTPRAEPLPLEAARAIAGTRNDLYVVGDGIVHFDGTKWSKLEVELGEAMLTCVAVHADRAYAAGEDGLLFVIQAGTVRRLVTSEDEPSFDAVHVDDDGTLRLAGSSTLQGKPEQLEELTTLPDDVEQSVGVGRFAGRTFWGGVGDGEGCGVFEQTAEGFEPLVGESGYAFVSTPEHLLMASETLILRFDGEAWRAMGLDWDEERAEWTLGVAEEDDSEDDAE